MINIKQTLFKNWSVMRLIRLGAALLIGYQAYLLHDKIAWALSGFFMFQALTNTGCCGVQSCNTLTPNRNNEIEEVQFEEVKNNKN
jgi:hypothetical protein